MELPNIPNLINVNVRGKGIIQLNFMAYREMTEHELRMHAASFIQNMGRLKKNRNYTVFLHSIMGSPY